MSEEEYRPPFNDIVDRDLAEIIRMYLRVKLGMDPPLINAKGTSWHGYYDDSTDEFILVME